MKKSVKKYTALAVLAVLVITAMFIYRYYREQQSRIYVTNIEFSDLMVDDSKDAKKAKEKEKASYSCSSVEEAGEKFRAALKNRKTKIVIAYKGEISDYSSMSTQIYKLAFSHTGVGDEGDYLNWNHTKVTRRYSSSTKTFTYGITYLDSADKEKKTTAAIKKIEKKLAINKSDSEYNKVKAIYDYIAANVTYDTEDKSDLPYSTYDAAVEGRAVCQGYATLFYRILLDYGIENRIIVSTTHAWNLVKIGDCYYECDVTWDSQREHRGDEYRYLLKARLSGSDHVWRTSVMSDEVTKLKRAGSDYVR
jgi:transglutaminase/protease-like cytokinesis protein 3